MSKKLFNTEISFDTPIGQYQIVIPELYTSDESNTKEAALQITVNNVFPLMENFFEE